ncbi:MAG: hypothetical protein DRI57_02075 [Deltaproteobacteria bacterium]|nr:MAG: hypothetical protein DRI57_02075 [Deltaproteobacteria bacterium]
MPFLHANDLLTDDFTELVRNSSFPEDAILMAFSPAEACFVPFEFDESFLAGTDQGRIFSPAGELKWRRTGDKMRVVYLGKDPFDRLEDYSGEMNELTHEQSEIILWRIGIDKKTEWKFPGRKAGLAVEKWLDSSGLARFSRYHSLREVA